MGKNKNQSQGQNQVKVAEEAKKPQVSGTTKPLPIGKPPKNAEEKALDEENVKKAAAKTAAIEEARKALKKAEEELKAKKAALKAEADREKNAKKAEKEKSLAERAKKEKEISEADEAVAKAQKDWDLAVAELEETKILAKAKERRAAIGPLPKIKSTRTGGVKKSPTGVTGKMVKILAVMTDGQPVGSAILAERTGILKGKPLPEMGELGLIDILVPEEGQRGRRFRITAKGREELAKATAEE